MTSRGVIWMVMVHCGFSVGCPFNVPIWSRLGTVNLTEVKIFLRQHRATFFLSDGEWTVAEGSARLRKFWSPYSRGAVLIFLCMPVQLKPLFCGSVNRTCCCVSWRDVHFTGKLIVPVETVTSQLRLWVCECRVEGMEAPVQGPSLLLVMTQQHHPSSLS